MQGILFLGTMRVKAHAKINWTLEVLGKRPDGYHDLRSIVLPVSLHDVVNLEPADVITCETEGLDVPQEKNLAYRAAVALRDATGCTQGVSISIEKRIPSGAGLGGGSSDAAAVLNALNVIRGEVSILVLDHTKAHKQKTNKPMQQTATTAINISISSP
jgi:4-diphosphocytidyl-2-C-methyl-D-erythritol kinase